MSISIRRTVLLVICTLLFSMVYAINDTISFADSCYRTQHYIEAKRAYKESLNYNPRPNIYYNLANTCYRLKQYSEAVLNYKRCLYLNPAHKDARYNLQLVRQQLAEKHQLPQTNTSEMFFFTWTRNISNLLNARGWAIATLILLTLALSVWMLSRYFVKGKLKNIGVTIEVIFFVLTILSLIFAYAQHKRYANNNEVVILVETSLEATPTLGGSKIKTLPAGVEAEKLGEKGHLFHVRLQDGVSGWVEADKVGLVKE